MSSESCNQELDWKDWTFVLVLAAGVAWVIYTVGIYPAKSYIIKDFKGFVKIALLAILLVSQVTFGFAIYHLKGRFGESGRKWLIIGTSLVVPMIWLSIYIFKSNYKVTSTTEALVWLLFILASATFQMLIPTFASRLSEKFFK